MKSTHNKLKQVNRQIAEFTAELAEINKWPDGADRRNEISKHHHFIGELLESKLQLLKEYEFDIELERQAIQKQIYERNNAAVQSA